MTKTKGALHGNFYLLAFIFAIGLPGLDLKSFAQGSDACRFQQPTLKAKPLYIKNKKDIPAILAKRINTPYKIHIEVVRTSLSDNNQEASLSINEINDFVSTANVIYKPAGIQFIFDPLNDLEPRIIRDDRIALDILTIPETNFNSPKNVPPTVDTTTPTILRNQLAANYPGKIVLIFSVGNSLSYNDSTKMWQINLDRAGGFSNWVDNFVAMPKNYGGSTLFAHEVGHYLHLAHTFSYYPASTSDAAGLMVGYRTNHPGINWDDTTQVFDADNPYVLDTPPDPGTSIFQNSGLDPCGAVDTINVPIVDPDGTLLTNVTLAPDRHNIMSYFKGCAFEHHLSNEQIIRVRNAIFYGNRRSLLGQAWIPSVPVALSRKAGTVDFFAIGTDNNLRHQAKYNNTWSSGGGWDFLGGTLTNPPALVSWGAERLDAFAIQPDGTVVHQGWEGALGWFPSQLTWEPLGGTMTGIPSVVSWGINRYDIFARGTNNAIWHKAWTNQGWWPAANTWESLGAIAADSPTAVAIDQNHLMVFVRGTDNQVWMREWANNQWLPNNNIWDALGGAITGTISAVARGPNHVDLFVRGLDGAVWQKVWINGQWLPAKDQWWSLGGVTTDSPTAISWGENRIDLFVRGANGGIFHKAWDTDRWYPDTTQWENLGGLTLPGSPQAVTSDINHIDIFTRGLDGGIWRKEWTPNGWIPQDFSWTSVGRYIE